MKGYNRNAGTPWTREAVKELKKLVQAGERVHTIRLKLGRTRAAIYKKAREEEISLRPGRVRTYYVQMPATGWVELKRKFKTECCDCGLVHTWELQEKKKGCFGFRIVRDNRATAQRRQHKKREWK